MHSGMAQQPAKPNGLMLESAAIFTTTPIASSMSDKDSIYSQPLDSIASFSFDKKVVQVFPDMIQRSVPGYSTIIAMTGVLAERYAQPQSHCYDLGSSLGASTLAMRQQLEGRDCKIIAVGTRVRHEAHQDFKKAYVPTPRSIRRPIWCWG